MIISLIVATDEQGVIGKDNQIPWNMPADMAHFKKTTVGHPVIMGRKTFESIGKPLAGRQNIVISRQDKIDQEGLQVTDSLDKAIALAVISHANEIFIIGGEGVFSEALPKAGRIYLTIVHAKVDGDRHFHFDASEWEEVSHEAHQSDDKNSFAYDFIVLERK
jgi:dihydrofolate reductase